MSPGCQTPSLAPPAPPWGPGGAPAGAPPGDDEDDGENDANDAGDDACTHLDDGPHRLVHFVLHQVVHDRPLPGVSPLGGVMRKHGKENQKK